MSIVDAEPRDTGNLHSIQDSALNPLDQRNTLLFTSSVISNAPVIEPSAPLAPPADNLGGSEISSRDAPVSIPEGPFSVDEVTLYSIHPGRIDRYKREFSPEELNELQVPLHNIAPVTFEFEREKLDGDWIPCIHPEGQLYFHKDEGSHRYLTDYYLYDPKKLEEIIRIQTIMEYKIQEEEKPLPATFEVVLEFLPQWNNSWGYYMVNHEKRCIFWVDEFNIHWAVSSTVPIIRSLAQIKHWLLHEYWKHWELFPHDRVVPDDVLDELCGVFLHSIVELPTSYDSIVVWTKEECSTLFQAVSQMKELKKTSAVWIATAASRLMSDIENQRFINFYGQYGARLNPKQSVHGHVDIKRGVVFTILSLLFFTFPETHYRHLNNLWVDRNVFFKLWKQYIKDLIAEWSLTNLLATVLLNSNIAFLAISSVSPSSHENTVPIPQIASILSTIASLGSVVFGLILVSQYRSQPDKGSTEVADYLKSCSESPLGLGQLALLYSLPYAFLMWGITTFIIAAVALCFQTYQDTSIRAVLAVIWAVFLSLTLWTALSSVEDSSWAKTSVEKLKRAWRTIQVHIHVGDEATQ